MPFHQKNYQIRALSTTDKQQKDKAATKTFLKALITYL